MKCWTLYLVLPGRFGPLISGLLTLITLTALQFALLGEVFWVSTGIYFAVILSYLPSVHAYILEITRNAILELRSNLLMTDEDIADITERMQRPEA